MNVKKRDGSVEQFDKDKLEESIVNAGADANTATKVAQTIAPKIREGMKTTDIKEQAAAELRRMDPGSAQSYESFRSEPELKVR